MPKQHYFFKLIPPRPTFPFDITSEQKRLMDEHSRYFQERFEAGEILLFGPVLAANGAFGVAVLGSQYRGRGSAVWRRRPDGKSRSKHIRDTPHAGNRRSR